MPDVRFGEPLFKLVLMSGTEWPVTLSDVLITLGILLLLFEVIKGARPGAKYFTDHLLSLIVFGAAAAELVLWSKFGTSTYFLLTALALVDFLSGLALRRGRRRAVAASAPVVEKKSARKAEPQSRWNPRGRTIRAPGGFGCRIPWLQIIRSRRPRNPQSSQMRSLRRSRHRACSLGVAHSLRRTARRADDDTSFAISISDDLPRPPRHAAAFLNARAISGLCIRERATPQAAGLRRLLGGRDQVRDEGCVRPCHGPLWRTSRLPRSPAPARHKWTFRRRGLAVQAASIVGYRGSQTPSA